MKDPTNTSPPSEDPAVIAEWRRLEAARLAEEQAEARDDAAEATHQPVSAQAERRWVLPAFLVALAAGGVVTVLVNRPRPQPVAPPQQAADVKLAAEVWAEANRIDEASLEKARARRIASTAGVSPEHRSVRVGIRDPQGRDRLESLLAASGLRIESDGAKPVDQAGAASPDSLAVSGRAADVDALLDRLIASPAMLEVVSPGLVAMLPGPGAEIPATEAAVDGAVPPAAVDQGALPTRVTLRFEVLELPADAPPVQPISKETD